VTQAGARGGSINSGAQAQPDGHRGRLAAGADKRLAEILDGVDA
jgi:hypothetical protein